MAKHHALNCLRTRPIGQLSRASYYVSTVLLITIQPPSTLTMDERARSRSPGRRIDTERERPRKPGGGFRWKDKRRDDDTRSGRDERRLERGYRDREDRGRSPRRERDADRDRDRHRDSERDRGRPDEEARRERKKKKAAAPAPPSEPMITVIVNDRLGTKAAIPCLASDPISRFPCTSLERRSS